LGFGGLIPFIVLALASWFGPVVHQAKILRALLAYAATIASFVGALHWGAAMHLAGQNSILSLVVCFVVDRGIYPRLGLSAWLSMRLKLTAKAALSCMAAGLSFGRLP
jgi:hypothetical protein